MIIMKNLKTVFKLLLVGLICLGLTGCASKSHHAKADAAPKKKLNPHRIKDATPQKEVYSKYGNPKNYVVMGKSYQVWNSHVGYEEKGMASWYGTKFHGRLTSSGEPYDMYAMTAAHKNLPIPCYAKVTNLENHKSIIVRVNDRGPFHSNRIIDLSYAAATKLDMLGKGTAHVKVEAIDVKQYKRGKYDDKVEAIVAPESVPEKDAVYLQVAAFSTRENADKLASEINSEAPTHVKKISNLWRVHVGPFESEQLAHEFKDKLSKFNLGEAFLVR